MLHILSLIAALLGALGIVLMLGCFWLEAMARRSGKPSKKEARWKGEDANVN